VYVQIHHIDPVKKEKQSGTQPQDVLIIGKLFNEGILLDAKTIALTGSQIKNQKIL
jgi:Na+-transporting NADH:ubiquinone oxidoreductase subunit A